MANTELKLRPVKFNVSLAGVTSGYQINETHEVEESFAIALCTEPADDPRATPVGWSLDEVAGVAKTAEPKQKKLEKEKPAPAAKQTPPPPPPAGDLDPELD